MGYYVTEHETAPAPDASPATRPLRLVSRHEVSDLIIENKLLPPTKGWATYSRFLANARPEADFR